MAKAVRVMPTLNGRRIVVPDSIGEGGGGTSKETDPTVPSFVKNITQADIDRWNAGGIDPSNYVTKEEFNHLRDEVWDDEDRLTNLISHLNENYYDKTEVYNKTEIDSMIASYHELTQTEVDEICV